VSRIDRPRRPAPARPAARRNDRTARAPAHKLLERERMTIDVEELPRVYVSQAESSMVCTVRYVVPVRTHRHWSSTFILAITAELAKPEHDWPRSASTVDDPER
jgi:hypothetical protein